MVLIGLNSVVDGLQLSVVRDEVKCKKSNQDKSGDGPPSAPNNTQRTLVEEQNQEPDLVRTNTNEPLKGKKETEVADKGQLAKGKHKSKFLMTLTQKNELVDNRS